MAVTHEVAQQSIEGRSEDCKVANTDGNFVLWRIYCTKKLALYMFHEEDTIIAAVGLECEQNFCLFTIKLHKAA